MKPRTHLMQQRISERFPHERIKGRTEGDEPSLVSDYIKYKEERIWK